MWNFLNHICDICDTCADLLHRRRHLDLVAVKELPQDNNYSLWMSVWDFYHKYISLFCSHSLRGGEQASPLVLLCSGDLHHPLQHRLHRQHRHRDIQQRGLMPQLTRCPQTKQKRGNVSSRLQVKLGL